MPRTPEQYNEMREGKRNLIMMTSLEHFANEGYYRTTINHIAKHAGISKGLMYNYFESKEALLKAIISKSVSDVFDYLDVNRDGYLTEDEFEYFVRKINVILKQKKSFWKLLFQLLMQNEVRDQFMKLFSGSESLVHAGERVEKSLPVSQIMYIISGYFFRKKDRMGEDYDPVADMNMFIIALKGFAITVTFAPEEDDGLNEVAINTIIRLFK